MLGSHLTLSRSNFPLRMQPIWMKWDPASGQSFAIAWRSGQMDDALSFHAADSGTLLTCCKLEKPLARAQGFDFYTWSPSGRFVLAAGRGCRWDPEDNCSICLQEHPEATVIGIDACHKFDIGPGGYVPCQKFALGWSLCSRYLHPASEGHKSGQYEFGRFRSGFIWDTLLSSFLFRWDESCDGTSHVIWPAQSKQSTESTTCIVAGHKRIRTLLLLPPLSGSASAARLPSYCVDEMNADLYTRRRQEPPCAISACGKLLVYIERYVRVPEGYYYGSRVSLSYPLQHREVLGVNARNEREATSSTSSWRLDSIAWHPCPATGGCLYAIANTAGAVYLMDGRNHVQLRSWSLQELGFRKGMNSHLHRLRTRLQWSPCGSQLVVAASGLITFLCFK